jgi:hypothetical protein
MLLDTNVLVYAHYPRDRPKQERALLVLHRRGLVPAQPAAAEQRQEGGVAVAPGRVVLGAPAHQRHEVAPVEGAPAGEGGRPHALHVRRPLVRLAVDQAEAPALLEHAAHGGERLVHRRRRLPPVEKGGPDGGDVLVAHGRPGQRLGGVLGEIVVATVSSAWRIVRRLPGARRES